MVPVTLFIWLLIEIASYMAFSRYWFNAPWDVAALGALGGVLGLRMGIVAITWAFAYAHPSPAPKLSTGQTIWMMLSEYLAFILTFILVIPFERLWMPADRLRPSKQPIILIHGYGCSRGVWWKIRRDLEAAGHTVASCQPGSALRQYRQTRSPVGAANRPSLQSHRRPAGHSGRPQHGRSGQPLLSCPARHCPGRQTDHHRHPTSGQRTVAVSALSAKAPAKWNPAQCGCAIWPASQSKFP
jgi:hypothetical protein